MTPAQKVFIETVISEFLKKEVINPEIEYQLGLPKTSCVTTWQCSRE